MVAFIPTQLRDEELGQMFHIWLNSGIYLVGADSVCVLVKNVFQIIRMFWPYAQPQQLSRYTKCNFF